MKFDQFIAIDWSGAKSPVYTKSLAVAKFDSQKNKLKLIEPHSNKYWSRQCIADWIMTLSQKASKTLIGIDCNFSYAEEILSEQFGPKAQSKLLWQEVEDLSVHDNNFYAEGFWSSEKYKKYFWTKGPRPVRFRLKQRQTETACSIMGLGHPESPFKLIGAKQVGKGGLSGMRLAVKLKKILGDKIFIWPFDDIKKIEVAQIIITEIYPRLFIKLAGLGHEKIRSSGEFDKAKSYFGFNQCGLLENPSDHETDALISALGLAFFHQQNPEYLRRPDIIQNKTIQREGWIFGVVPDSLKQ